MNKKYTYTVLAIAILAIGAWAIYAYNQQNKNAANNSGQAPVQDNSNNTVSPAATSTPQTGSVVPKKLPYGAAINTYPYRFQFSQCHGNPGQLAVKKGTVVMLDNRDSIAHTFKADSQTFKIAGYDYALLKTSAISNVNITCDGGGAALLNVEK